MANCCCFAVWIIACLECTSAFRTAGKLAGGPGLKAFVGKFCFDYDPSGKTVGAVEITVEFDGPAVNTVLQLHVFSDEDHSWEQVWHRWENLTCRERHQYAKVLVPFWPSNESQSYSTTFKQRVRPRFWYFTFCVEELEYVQSATYTLHAFNYPIHDFNSEFGVDERGLLTWEILAVVLFSSLVAALWHSRRGSARHRTQPLVLLLSFSCVLSAVGAGCLAANTRAYAIDGAGWESVRLLGVLCIGAARAALSVLQLVVAKGRDILDAPTEQFLRRGAVCVLALALATSFACEVYEGEYGDTDWSTTLYMYSSWPGVVILLLNTLLFCEVARAMVDVYAYESLPQIHSFYKKTFAISSIFFLALPVTCILAHVFAPWVRKKFVARIEVSVRALVAVALAYCMKPSRMDHLIDSRLERAASRGRAVEMADRLAQAGGRAIIEE